MNYEKLRPSDTHDRSPLGLLVEAWTAYGPIIEELLGTGVLKLTQQEPILDPSVSALEGQE